MIYRGQEIPLPNPDLFLTWTFFRNGTVRLYWDRGGKDFCERYAHYQVSDSLLKEEVFALNPQNSADCSKDPDMQLGRQTSNKIKVLDSEIQLFFSLGDEELIYVLKPLNWPI